MKEIFTEEWSNLASTEFDASELNHLDCLYHLSLFLSHWREICYNQSKGKQSYRKLEIYS